jgi:epoxyqueuosine reductase QueG
MDVTTRGAATEEVVAFAKSLGADLVGIAPVSRWAKAPIEHAPLGIFPKAQSVIVCAVQFLDAITELGARPDPRIPGAAHSELHASDCLQFIGFRLGKYLEQQGYRAVVPIQSGQWAYRPSAGAPRGWMADMVHYYAAACAGLGEIGWNNLCLTPEFGSRQRFISTITDADLTPSPLYNGPALCDRCKLCARHCPTQSFDVDNSGQMLAIEIDEKRYEFPDRNLWRCAIGENLMLDVFLPEWKDAHVDEALVTKLEELAVTRHHEWVTGWKMGMCIKHCVPPQRRYFDRAYCGDSPRRRRDVTPDPTPATVAMLTDELCALARDLEVDVLATVPAASFAAHGIVLTELMPDAQSAVVLELRYPDGCALNTRFLAKRAALQLGKLMQERYGYSAMTLSGIDDATAAAIAGLPAGVNREWRTILTGAPLSSAVYETSAPRAAISQTPDALTTVLREEAHQAGAELIGFASADTLREAAASLQDFGRAHPDYFVVRNQGWKIERKALWGGQGHPYNPIVEPISLQAKTAEDYLPGAQSVIVVGMHLLEGSIDHAGTPPAHKAGHYMSTTHHEIWQQLNGVLRTLARTLEAQGYRAVPVHDFDGLASEVYGWCPDMTSSRFAALAAGLGELGWNGLVLTPEFGARQRFAVLVTDAPLAYTPVYQGPSLCRQCGACVAACSVGAIDQQEHHAVTIGGRTFTWGRQDRLRCDCAKRYAFVPEEGPALIGNTNTFTLPEVITPAFVVEAMRESDRMQRPSYCPIIEHCFTACPAHRRSEE